MRVWRSALILALLVAGCGGADGTDPTSPTRSTLLNTTSTTTSTPTSTTTTVEPTTTTTLSEEDLAAIQFGDDVQAIKTLWRRFSDSWSGSSEAGYQYITEHNHPLEECTGEDWKEWRELPPDYWLEVVIDDTTIERDDGWPMPSGPNAGEVPDGRIYIMTGTFNDAVTAGETTLEIHSVVAPDGTPYFFFSCR